jgi:DNA-binding ferritin-like protein
MPVAAPTPVNEPETITLKAATIEPPYGILKRGTKPTFRQWHNKTQRNRAKISKPKELVQEVKKTYSLGRKGNYKLSVFLKNKKTRKKIQDEMSNLKKKPIEEIKEYLRNHNMIKAGSNAPHDVLRELYQTSHLAGDISNKTTDTLIHNYLADEEKEN